MTDKGGKPRTCPLGYRECFSYCYWWKEGKCDFRRRISNLNRRKERIEDEG